MTIRSLAQMKAIASAAPEELAKVVENKSLAYVKPTAMEVSEKIPLRRVTEADFDELIGPSLSKFQERWPNLTAESTYLFCRSMLNNNQGLMIRTTNAWGAATFSRPFFEPFGIVSERFVVSIRNVSGEGLWSEPLAIYAAMRKWAISIGAAEWTFGSSTGMDLAPFAKRLGMAEKPFKVYGQRLRNV